MNNLTEEMKKELTEALKKIAESASLSFLLETAIAEDEIKMSRYIDQDRHTHLIVKTDYYNKEQLDGIYNYLFLTGTTCRMRSELSRKLSIDVGNIRIDNITVASLLQYSLCGPTDMQLMSNLLAWLHCEI